LKDEIASGDSEGLHSEGLRGLDDVPVPLSSSDAFERT
jgi:hypothetical protein